LLPDPSHASVPAVPAPLNGLNIKEPVDHGGKCRTVVGLKVGLKGSKATGSMLDTILDALKA